jgi:hypothetical protein
VRVSADSDDSALAEELAARACPGSRDELSSDAEVDAVAVGITNALAPEFESPPVSRDPASGAPSPQATKKSAATPAASRVNWVVVNGSKRFDLSCMFY